MVKRRLLTDITNRASRQNIRRLFHEKVRDTMCLGADKIIVFRGQKKQDRTRTSPMMYLRRIDDGR